MILDSCCGGKIMYRGLDRNFNDNELIFIDIRQGKFSYKHPRFPKVTNVRPTIVADMQHLPFRDGVFSMVIFDPPHDKYGKRSYMALRYGSISDEDYEALLENVNSEFSRVLRPLGILLAKISGARRKITMIELRNFRMLLDNAYWSKAYHCRKKTHWIHFVKRI